MRPEAPWLVSDLREGVGSRGEVTFPCRAPDERVYLSPLVLQFRCYSLFKNGKKKNKTPKTNPNKNKNKKPTPKSKQTFINKNLELGWLRK